MSAIGRVRASMVRVRSWMKNRRQGSDPQCLNPEKGHGHNREKSLRQSLRLPRRLTVTERSVRGDVSESHQEEVKKPEEQASAVTQTAEFPESALTTADSLRGRVEVNVCKDGREEKLRSSMETLSGRRRCSIM